MEDIPLSPYVIEKMESRQETLTTFYAGGMTAGSYFMILAVITSMLFFGMEGVFHTFVQCLCYLAFVWGVTKWTEGWIRRQAKAENEHDYQTSREIRESLAGFNTTELAHFPVAEECYPGEYKIESCLLVKSEEDEEGDVKNSKMDYGRVLFLKEEKSGQKLKAFVTNKDIIEKTFEKFIEKFITVVDKDGSYVQTTLEDFCIPANLITNFITSTRSLLLRLEKEENLAPTERLRIKIYGKTLEEGTVLLSAIQIGDETTVIYPTGFIKEMENKLLNFFEKQKKTEDRVEKIFL